MTITSPSRLIHQNRPHSLHHKRKGKSRVVHIVRDKGISHFKLKSPLNSPRKLQGTSMKRYRNTYRNSPKSYRHNQKFRNHHFTTFPNFPQNTSTHPNLDTITIVNSPYYSYPNAPHNTTSFIMNFHRDELQSHDFELHRSWSASSEEQVENEDGAALTDMEGDEHDDEFIFDAYGSFFNNNDDSYEVASQIAAPQ